MGLAVVLLPAGTVARAQAPASTQIGERRWLETSLHSASTGKRVALVMGNTHYGGRNELKNPGNDARAMAHTLQALGFDVLMCLDQTNRQMDDDIAMFRDRISGASVALFYFSGHGAQLGGENYLIPVGFNGQNEADIKYDAMNVGRLLDSLEDASSSAHRINIVILDACRDNPFADGNRSLSHSRGLAPIDAPGGTLIAYATAPGKTAEDNAEGENGLYTKALLDQIKTPGLRIEDVFINTRKAVRKASDNKQVPWEESSLEDQFYFASSGKGGNSPLPPSPDTAAHLTVTVNAPGATILVDGQTITPGQEADIDLGLDKTRNVEIGVAATGYTAIQQSYTLAAGKHAIIPITLAALPPPLAVVHIKSGTIQGHAGGVWSAAFSPDGQYIVTASQDKTARVWDSQTGSLSKTLQGHTGRVNSAAFSRDGRYIVTASQDSTAIVWDAETGSPVHTLQGHAGGVWSAAFSPDGQYIVTASADNTARIWDARTGNLSKTLQGHTGQVFSAAFSPDSRSIITASSDKTVRLWDAQTGNLSKTLQGHTGGVNSAVFSPDGRYIVTASGDETARIWEAKTGSLLHTLQEDAGEVLSAAFSPDSRYIVTGHFDFTAKVWDVKTGSLLHTLRGHRFEVHSAAFSPDGRYIVTASQDHTTKVWDAQAGE